MPTIALRLGATFRSECSIEEPSTHFDLTFEAVASAEAVFLLNSPTPSFAMSLDTTATNDGAEGGPYPGFAFIPDYDLETVGFDFELSLSQLDSFVFPAEFDGTPEADVADGGAGPVKGMAYQDPTNVAIEGGSIRNVTLVGITVDGGTF